MFVTPDKTVHRAVLEELKGLFVPLLSGHPARHQAALLLGLIAEALETGDDDEEIRGRLNRDMRIIGPQLAAGDWPGVIEEALPSARICLTLSALRSDLDTSDVDDDIPEPAREAVAAARRGEQRGFATAMEIALELAQSGS